MATSPSTTIKTRMTTGPAETLDSSQQPTVQHPDHQESNTINTTATNSNDVEDDNCVALSLAEALKTSQQQMEMRQIELIYRAEGNANLVLALPQFKKVLRLPKAEPAGTNQDISSSEQAYSGRLQQGRKQQLGPTGPTSQSTSESVVNQNAKANRTAVVGSLTMKDFADYIEIVRRLMGNAFVLDVDIVSMPSDMDRRWINDTIRPHRPAHRLTKEFCGHFGLLLPDATQLAARDLAAFCPPNSQPPTGDTYAIEIKPKQGWLLPNNLTDIIHSEAADGVPTEHTKDTEGESQPAQQCLKVSGRHCRYCAMQYLKIKNGKISAISSYCPLDLFSGDPHQMTTALNALFACPQNNLRVFRNGVCVYGGGDDNMAAMSHTIIDDIFSKEMLTSVKQILIESLLKDFGGNFNEEQHKARSKSTSSLPANCVLQKILHLQLLAQSNFNAMLASGFAQHTAKSYQIVRTLLPKLHTAHLNEQMLSASEQYLLGATALDCSIMVAFQEIPRECWPHTRSPNVIAVPAAERCYVSKVAILDLDPKPDSHFAKYLKQSQQAYQCARH